MVDWEGVSFLAIYYRRKQVFESNLISFLMAGIQFEDMAYTIGQGFAVVGANNGHDGRSGKAFLNSPEVIADFAYRSYGSHPLYSLHLSSAITNQISLTSIHTGVVVGKQITKEFYGTKHKKSYYLGCSTGGRQGFKSVQDFPYDFDGVVAGAPALDFNNLNAWSNHFYLITGKNTSASFVPIPLWTKVHTEILNQCDGFDGLKDGIIEDPSLCNFNASALLCAHTDSTDCLTSAQVNTVTEVFSGLYGQDGALVYPRMQPGSELSAAGFYYGGLPSPFTVSQLACYKFGPPQLTICNRTGMHMQSLGTQTGILQR